MPAAIEYVPPTDSRRNALNTELIAERQRRRDRYLTALKYYDGNHPDQLEYDPDIEPNDNTHINLVQITADRTASFLFPAVPIIQIDPDAIAETDEEKWARTMIEDNGGLFFLIKLAIRGFLAGHAFVRVIPPRKIGRTRTKPKLVLLDPLTVTIFWNADDVGEVLWYENRYKVGDDVMIQDYVWRPEKGEAGEWEIYTYKAEAEKVSYLLNYNFSPHGAGSQIRSEYMDYIDAGSFKLVPAKDGRDYAIHASPIPPIIEFAHLPHPDDRYGHGEVTQKDLQDTINRVWSAINRIVRKHSDPVDVILGADVDDIEQGDDVMTVPQNDAKVQRLEMRGDLTAAVSTVEKLIETYLSVARVVLLKGEAKDLQRVTNASVRTLFVDALAKNEILRHSYGNAIERMVKLAMMMSGEPFAPKAADLDIVCQWPEALPVDKTEVANINAILVPMGVRSKRTAAKAMGDNWAFEQAAIETEAEQDLKRALAKAKQFAEITPPDAPSEEAPKGNAPDLKPKPGVQIKAPERG